MHYVTVQGAKSNPHYLYIVIYIGDVGFLFNF